MGRLWRAEGHRFDLRSRRQTDLRIWKWDPFQGIGVNTFSVYFK